MLSDTTSKTKIGTTFARGYAESLGLDPKKTLDEIIKLGLNPIRIGVYWEEVEIKPGQFDFSNFDWIVEKLSYAKIDIILAIGAKTPRWPEFHLPEFIRAKYHFKNKEVINNNDFLADVKVYLKKVLDHYKNEQQIKYIQVENEPFEPFGPNKWTLSLKFVAEEIKYVREMTRLPIIITNGGMDPIPPIIGHVYGKYKRLGECLNQNTDLVGLDVYPIIPQKVLEKYFYFKAGESQWKKLAEIKNQIENNKGQKKKAWITELQAEPWEPKKMNTANPLANPSCNPDLVGQYLKKCQQLGFEVILLWGVEFWLACQNDGNNQWIKAISNYLNNK